MKKIPQTLNEEQVAQAKKDRGNFFYPIFECIETSVPKGVKEPRCVYIETERWVDARAYAYIHFGVHEVKCKLHEMSGRPVPRIQLRWTGNGASNTLLRQVRELISASMNPEEGWKAVR